MPTVPTLGPAPSVSPTPLQDPQIDRLLYRTIGAGGQELENVGRGLMGIGDDAASYLNQQQQQANEAAVKMADANAITGIATVLHGDGTPDNPGYLNKLGGNAVAPAPGATDATGNPLPDPHAKALSDLDQVLQSTGDSLTNPRQQAMFAQTAALRRAAAIDAINSHASTQAAQYADDASKARAGAATTAAVQAFDPTPGADNSLYLTNVHTAQLELESQAQARGLSPTGDGKDLHDQFIAQGMTPLFAQITGNLVDGGKTSAANAYFQSVKSQMDPKVADKLQAALQIGADQDSGLKTAIDVGRQIPNDINAQETELQNRFTAGSITEPVYKQALSALRADAVQQRDQISDQVRKVDGDAWMWFKQHPGATDPLKLPPTLLAQVQQLGIGSHMDSFAAANARAAPGGDPVGPDNLVLTGKLLNMAANDPDGFTKAIEQGGQTLQAQMSKTQWRAVQQTYLDIQQASPLASVPKTVQQTLAGLRTSIDAQFPPAQVKANPTGPVAQGLADYQNQVHDAIYARQASLKSQHLDPNDARSLALGLLTPIVIGASSIPWATPGTSLWHPFSSSGIPPATMTLGQRAMPWEIPSADRARITTMLQNAKKPPTEDNIQHQFKWEHGVQ